MQWLFGTDNSLSSLVLRVGAGALMLPAGLMKMGLMGDGSFGGTIEQLGGMGIPAIIAILVIIGESVGAASLILGFCTRFCAASLAVIMAGAVFFTYGQGFGVFSFPLALLLMYVSLAISGGGMLSIDRFLAKR